MSSKLFLLLSVAFHISCSANRIEIPPQQNFSSTNDAVIKDCPLAQIDSLAPCRVPLSVAHTELEWIAANGSVQTRGDTLVFAVHAPIVREVRVSGGIELPLLRLGNSSIFAGAAYIPFSDGAVISYRIFTDTTRGVSVRFEFRGDRSGERPPRARKLRGSLRMDTVRARSLDESRELISYVPAGVTSDARCDVVYVPDGGLVKQLAPLVDTLVAAGRIKPVVLVGVRAHPQMRAQEYVWGFNNDTTRFVAHEAFFTEDVIPWAEATLPVARARTGRMIWGASNGGAFAIAMGLRHPDLFAKVFASSPVFELIPKTDRKMLPLFYIAAGTFEGTSRDRAFGLKRVLADLGANVHFDEIAGGHDEVVWIEWMARMLVGNGGS